MQRYFQRKDTRPIFTNPKLPTEMIAGQLQRKQGEIDYLKDAEMEGIEGEYWDRIKGTDFLTQDAIRRREATRDLSNIKSEFNEKITNLSNENLNDAKRLLGKYKQRYSVYSKEAEEQEARYKQRLDYEKSIKREEDQDKIMQYYDYQMDQRVGQDYDANYSGGTVKEYEDLGKMFLEDANKARANSRNRSHQYESSDNLWLKTSTNNWTERDAVQLDKMTRGTVQKDAVQREIDTRIDVLRKEGSNINKILELGNLNDKQREYYENQLNKIGRSILEEERAEKLLKLSPEEYKEFRIQEIKDSEALTEEQKEKGINWYNQFSFDMKGKVPDNDFTSEEGRKLRRNQSALIKDKLGELQRLENSSLSGDAIGAYGLTFKDTDISSRMTDHPHYDERGNLEDTPDFVLDEETGNLSEEYTVKELLDSSNDLKTQAENLTNKQYELSVIKQLGELVNEGYDISQVISYAAKKYPDFNIAKYQDEITDENGKLLRGEDLDLYLADLDGKIQETQKSLISVNDDLREKEDIIYNNLEKSEQEDILNSWFNYMDEDNEKLLRKVAIKLGYGDKPLEKYTTKQKRELSTYVTTFNTKYNKGPMLEGNVSYEANPAKEVIIDGKKYIIQAQKSIGEVSAMKYGDKEVNVNYPSTTGYFQDTESDLMTKPYSKTIIPEEQVESTTGDMKPDEKGQYNVGDAKEVGLNFSRKGVFANVHYEGDKSALIKLKTHGDMRQALEKVVDGANPASDDWAHAKLGLLYLDNQDAVREVGFAPKSKSENPTRLDDEGNKYYKRKTEFRDGRTKVNVTYVRLDDYQGNDERYHMVVPGGKPKTVNSHADFMIEVNNALEMEKQKNK